MKRILLLLTLLLIAAPGGRAAPAFQAPVLKWQRGGCTSWCEAGWYSSPAVADLDGDGQMEVVGAAYSVFALDGTTGATEPALSRNPERSEGTAKGFRAPESRGARAQRPTGDATNRKP